LYCSDVSWLATTTCSVAITAICSSLLLAVQAATLCTPNKTLPKHRSDRCVMSLVPLSHLSQLGSPLTSRPYPNADVTVFCDAARQCRWPLATAAALSGRQHEL